MTYNFKDSVTAIQNGQAQNTGNLTDAGTLTGTEQVNVSKTGGLFGKTLTNVGNWIAAVYQVFQQSGTGATTRTLLAKMQDIPLTPEDFGAVGDYNYTTGTGTDNTTALQNCINAASVTGQTIKFKAGAKYMTGDLYAYYDATLNPNFAAKPGRIFFIGEATGIDTGSLETQGAALVHKAGSTGNLLSILGVFSISTPGLTGMGITIERLNLHGATTSASVLWMQDCTEQISMRDMFIRQRNPSGKGWYNQNNWGIDVSNVQIRGDDPSDGTWTGKGLYLVSDTSTGQINMQIYRNLDVYKANGIYIGRNGVSTGTFGPIIFIGGQTSYASDYGVTLAEGAYNCHFLGFQIEQSRYSAVLADGAAGFTFGTGPSTIASPGDLPRNCTFQSCYFTNNGKIIDGSSNQFDVQIGQAVDIEFKKCLHQNSNSGYYFNLATSVDLRVIDPYFRTLTSYGTASGYGFNYTGSFTPSNRIYIRDPHYDASFSNNPGPDAGAIMGYIERDLRRLSVANNSATPSISLGGSTGVASADILNFNNSSATTVTSILGGRIGQRLILTFSNANTTISSNQSTIYLRNGLNFIPSETHATIELTQVYTGVWCEVSRANTAQLQTASTTGTSLTTGTTANVASVSLGAGTWDIHGVVIFNPAGTTVVSTATAGSSSTSATLSTPDTYTTLPISETGLVMNMNVPWNRITLASTTTIYLVAQATFTTSTMTADGYIKARPV